jgi:hypothetical protein
MVLKQSLLLPLFTDNFTIPTMAVWKVLFTSQTYDAVFYLQALPMQETLKSCNRQIDVQTILLKKKGPDDDDTHG